MNNFLVFSILKYIEISWRHSDTDKSSEKSKNIIILNQYYWGKWLIIVIFFQIQFCIIFHHNFQVLFRDCGYPKVLNFLLATQAAYFLYLFGKFYHKQYIKSQKAKDAKLKKDGEVPNGITNGKISNSSENKQKVKWNVIEQIVYK